MKKKEMVKCILSMQYSIKLLQGATIEFCDVLRALAVVLGYDIIFEGDGRRCSTPNPIVRYGNGFVISKFADDPQAVVDTDRVKNVTLEELARFVIDGKPIARHEIAVVEYAPECHIAERNSENEKDTNTI